MTAKNHYIDPVAVAIEADVAGKSGETTRQLLAKGYTLLGIDEATGHFVRLLPSGEKDFGHLLNGEFVVDKNFVAE